MPKSYGAPFVLPSPDAVGFPSIYHVTEIEMEADWSKTYDLLQRQSQKIYKLSSCSSKSHVGYDTNKPIKSVVYGLTIDWLFIHQLSICFYFVLSNVDHNVSSDECLTQ